MIGIENQISEQSEITQKSGISHSRKLLKYNWTSLKKLTSTEMKFGSINEFEESSAKESMNPYDRVRSKRFFLFSNIESDAFNSKESPIVNKRASKYHHPSSLSKAYSPKIVEKHFELIKEKIMKQGDVEAILK